MPEYDMAKGVMAVDDARKPLADARPHIPMPEELAKQFDDLRNRAIAVRDGIEGEIIELRERQHRAQRIVEMATASLATYNENQNVGMDAPMQKSSNHAPY